MRNEYGKKYYEATQWKTTFQFLAGITKLAEYPVVFLSNLLSKDEVTMYSWLYESQNLPLLTSVLGSDKSSGGSRGGKGGAHAPPFGSQ